MASLDHGALDKNILLCMVQRVRPPAFLDAKFSGARHCAMFVVSGFPLGLLLWSAASRLVFRRVVSSFQLAFKFFGSIDCSALLLPCGSTVYYSMLLYIALLLCRSTVLYILYTALLLYCSMNFEAPRIANTIDLEKTPLRTISTLMLACRFMQHVLSSVSRWA